jgi:hypothetical protein
MTYIFKQFRAKVGIYEGPLASNKTVPPAIIKTTIIFPVNVSFGRKITNLTSESNRET